MLGSKWEIEIWIEGFCVRGCGKVGIVMVIVLIVVRDSNTNGQIADGSIDAEILAFKAKDKVLHQDWVSLLKPCWFLFIIFYYFRFRSI